jgi:two-component system, cell cycle sensor histidine kinase and response regulator CckA
MRHETILVVDDEEDIVDVSREILNSMGYKVLVAKSGQEAVAAYIENRGVIDLIILDMIMPGMSGEKTFQSLLEIDRNIRILLVSGCSMDGRIQNLLDSGCKGFIQKPFRISELSRKVREALDDNGKY